MHNSTKYMFEFPFAKTTAKKISGGNGYCFAGQELSLKVVFTHPLSFELYIMNAAMNSK